MLGILRRRLAGRIERGGADMEKVIVDADGRVKLNEHTGEVEIADPLGRTLGYFVPPEQYDEMQYAWLNRDLTLEERQAIQEEYRTNAGLTTAEAIEYVRGGGTPGGAGK
jgi:hypothetical protein